ncbi:hypothetical protein [Actinomadura macrotermitis]|uniref:Uncharacterized protein n=1 Tax=Actinomadura macrotermitis TaxID=2585200 RepID=A0A7K0BXV4_9ACTN|nr:hypothetical protein [Actinomadura macrotermitis]MQY05916.1 hypothetical protein [Actinomadura macrotermitis]
MAAPEKRLPGQSNAEYERRRDPNADFIGMQSMAGGGDPTRAIRYSQAFFAWFNRVRGRKAN